MRIGQALLNETAEIKRIIKSIIKSYKMEPQKKNVVTFKAFRGQQSWTQIIKQALYWMNECVNLNRIISISTVFCHHNNDGLVTVYFMQSLAQPQHHSSTIDAQIIRDKNTWNNHSKTVAEKVTQISVKGTVLAINDLEINEDHQQGFTVIWYLKPKQ